MTITKEQATRYVAAAAILFAVTGITPFEPGCTDQAWVWDKAAQDWRPVTPDDTVAALEETAQIAKTAVEETPAAIAIPWIDAATRLLAVLVAFRWSKPKKPETSPEPAKV